MDSEFSGSTEKGVDPPSRRICSRSFIFDLICLRILDVLVWFLLFDFFVYCRSQMVTSRNSLAI